MTLQSVLDVVTKTQMSLLDKVMTRQQRQERRVHIQAVLKTIGIYPLGLNSTNFLNGQMAM
jgi:hypothetical protein